MFGSKSEFDEICYRIISELKKEYRDILRVAYTCKSESIIKEEEKEKYEKAYYNLCGKKIEFAVFDLEVEHKNKNRAGKAGYVERNMAMIDDSTICLVYYNQNYLPPKRKRSKNSLFEYQPPSGTAIAVKYAQKQKKEIINLYKEKGLV